MMKNRYEKETRQVTSLLARQFFVPVFIYSDEKERVIVISRLLKLQSGTKFTFFVKFTKVSAFD